MADLYSNFFTHTTLRIPGGCCVLLLLSALQSPAIAQVSEATIKEVLSGDRVFIEQEKATVSDRAEFRQTIRTEGETRAEIGFNNGSVGRLAENSTVTVGQCVEVNSGQLLISGPANGCMTDFTTAVRGTVYILEKDPESPRGSSGILRVLEGSLELQPTQEGRTSDVVRVARGQQIGLTQTGIPGTLRAIPPQDFIDIINGPFFQGYRQAVPNQEKLQAICQSLYPNSDCTVASSPETPNSEPIPGLW